MPDSDHCRDPSAALARDALHDAPPGPVCIGLSGGLDSTVLAWLLAGSAPIRRQGLRALHVDHGLHPEAARWTAHCQALCDQLDIDLAVVRVAVDRSAGDGPEAAARHARHAAFEAALQPGEILALAHHREDQAETFLLRALRASGVDGLAAMRRTRPLGRGLLWRPLLSIGRDRLQACARAAGLGWIEDSSNEDLALDRNYLRHEVMPGLRARWPQADAALARSAALCAEAAALLDAEDRRAVDDCLWDDGRSLAVVALRAQSPARRARILRCWVERLGLSPLPAAGVRAIEADLLPSTPDTQPEFAWHGGAIRRWRDRLVAVTPAPPWPADWEADWDGRTPLRLPGGASLSLLGAPAFAGQLRVHARRGGERITLPGRSHSHRLKHVLQALDVPPWQRASIPLLSRGEELLAAGDLVYAAGFDAWLRAHDARLAWQPAWGRRPLRQGSRPPCA